jgi:MFS superfamily sulfate permease-like transporter
MAAGARSQVANLVAAMFCLLTLIWLTPLFQNMPEPVLAAIVIAAMLHLTKPKYLQNLFARSSLSFANAMIVIAAELTLGVLHGIALGVVLALLNLIYQTSHPRGAVLGQLPGTEAYRSLHRHPEVITFPGLLIWRIGGDLFFASIGHVREALQASLAARADVKRVLLDFGAVNFIDVTASDDLLSLIKQLENKGITAAFARVRDVVRDDMRLAGIEAVVGANGFHERITDGVIAWQRSRTPNSERSAP